MKDQAIGRGLVMLGLYILLRGSDSTLLKALQRAAASTEADGGPVMISFCNVFFVSSLVCGLIMVALHSSSMGAELPTLSPSDRRLLALQSFTGFFLGPMAFFLALDRLTVLQQTLLFSLGVPVGAIAAVVLLKETLPRTFSLSCVLILAGLLVASQHPTDFTAGMMVDPRGVGWALIGVTAFGLSGAINRRVSQRGLGAGFTVGINSLGASIAFGLIALIAFGPGHVFHLRSWWLLGVVGGYAVLVTLGSQWSLMEAYSHFDTVTITLWAPLATVVAIAEAYVFLGESPGTPGVIGASLIVAAAMLNQLGSRSIRRT